MQAPEAAASALSLGERSEYYQITHNMSRGVNGHVIGMLLVINAVTLETELLLLNQQASHGGNLTRIAIAHASPLGHQTRYSGWRPAMPVMQWSWTR